MNRMVTATSDVRAQPSRERADCPFTSGQLRDATRVLRAACAQAAVFGPPPPSSIRSAQTSRLRLSFAVDHAFDVAFTWSQWEEGAGSSQGRTPYRSDADLRATAARHLTSANSNAAKLLSHYWPTGLSVGFGDGPTRLRQATAHPQQFVCQSSWSGCTLLQLHPQYGEDTRDHRQRRT